YLFLLRPDPWLATAAVMVLAMLTFAPFKFVHPFRVRRLRYVTIAMLGAWSALALVAILSNLDPDPWTKMGLVAAALYFLGLGLTDRTSKPRVMRACSPLRWSEDAGKDTARIKNFEKRRESNGTSAAQPKGVVHGCGSTRTQTRRARGSDLRRCCSSGARPRPGSHQEPRLRHQLYRYLFPLWPLSGRRRTAFCCRQ